MQEMEEMRDTCARYIQTLVSLALAQQVFLTSRGRAIKQIRILEESACWRINKMYAYYCCVATIPVVVPLLSTN